MSVDVEELKRCLHSAHCADDFVEQVCPCTTNQSVRDVKRLLFKQRRQLLHEIHKQQHALDQIDHLIWQLDHDKDAKNEQITSINEEGSSESN